MKMFSKFSKDGLFWFRIFGYGITGKDVRKHRLYYSERHGYQKFLKIGNWYFKWLTPWL
jgi:hypothetical protein